MFGSDLDKLILGCWRILPFCLKHATLIYNPGRPFLLVMDTLEINKHQPTMQKNQCLWTDILKTQILVLIPDLTVLLLKLAESVKRKCLTCVSKVGLC